MKQLIKKGLRKCWKCKKIKRLELFAKDRNRRGGHGHSYKCKKCQNKDSKRRQKEWLKNAQKKYGIRLGTMSLYGFKLSFKIYERYKRKCIYCMSKYDLTIHHIDHKGLNVSRRERNNKEENLVLICRSCHGKIHGKEGGRGNRKKY